MSKHEEKFRQEEELLRKICEEDPEDYDLIQNSLKLLKTQNFTIEKKRTF